MTQQGHGNPSDMAAVVKETRKTRKALKDMEYRVESRILEMKDQAQKMKVQQDQTTRNIQSALAFTFFVVIASHFLFYPTLTMKNMNTRMETTKLKEEAVSDPDILTAMVGSWKPVSSTGMEEFVQAWKSVIAVSQFSEDRFRFGMNHFEYDRDHQNMTTYQSVGMEMDQKEDFRLGEQLQRKNHVKTYIVQNNQLVLVAVGKNKEEYTRVYHFVKNGQLHIVQKRWGLTVERIFEKVDYEEMKKKLKQRIQKLEKTEFEKLCAQIRKLFSVLWSAFERVLMGFERLLKTRIL